ncbi:hypothetical protein O181_048726 [Austropuccinia psidii MF-1]|uniref:Uncharacterized protein n=1 Tax=Austropuccinia psidii MF-1 TaxID=1389203 RepID=A0A9Q3DR71_9BASI|nr:hypothetical protein [Austropuccinia psidii MF-1]
MVNLIYDSSKSTDATMLLSHVYTRWNSTYDMLEHALSLKEAYNHYCGPPNMEHYQLTSLEWEKAKVMVNFLQPLNKTTLIICGSSYPTLNQALPLYLILVKQINQVGNSHNPTTVYLG